MTFTHLVSLLALSAALGLALGVGCKSFGEWATAEDQNKWGPPCRMRGPQYELACIDDPTIEGAEDACPCHPVYLIERLTGPNNPDGGSQDASSKDAK